ncbi:periplasmic heavy metal sensor [Sphingomonas sp. PAMC 26617]|uniref:periplasmic heavy metal sensor n=1 Tax=Sphingomonas sp. PAMC 26617 TaxID=1112216 RepID=UPI000287D1A4|nr:periplasmic heavy metal sensor [Sphingomonas sp. PAMC 26617]
MIVVRGRLLLIASLLLNLFLAGALVGGAAWVRDGHRMIAAGALRVAGSELPRAERRAFRVQLRAARESVRPLINESNAAKADAARLLAQPSPNVPATKAALAKARADDFRVRTVVEDRALDFAATLQQTDRQRIADALVGRMQKRGR